MSLNDSLFGEEAERWKDYEIILKKFEDQKRATQNEKEYNNNTNKGEDMKTSPYKETVIERLVLENESTPQGLKVEVRASSTKQVIIEIGNTCTLRLEGKSAVDLVSAIERAVISLPEPRDIIVEDNTRDAEDSVFFSSRIPAC